VRGKANALCTSFNWAFNFALGYFVPPAFQNIGWKVYILFGVFCATMFLHVLFMFPETAGKSLEEVEAMFLDPKGIKYLGTPAWRTGVVKSGVEEGRVGLDLHGEKLERFVESRGGFAGEHAPDEEAAVEAREHV